MRFGSTWRLAFALAALTAVPSFAHAQFEHGSISGVVLDSISRKLVGSMSVTRPIDRGGSSAGYVRPDGQFELPDVPVGDRASITFFCPPGEPMHNRVVARAHVPVRARQTTKIEVLIDYSACFAPIATKQRIRASGFFYKGKVLDATFIPCSYEPFATALSVWSYPALLTLAKRVYRTPDAPDQWADVSPNWRRAFVQFAGTVRGPGVYGGSVHAPYEIVVDSLFEVDSSRTRQCDKRDAAPSLEPGTVTVVEHMSWRASNAPPPAWFRVPRDSSNDVPPSKLTDHGNVEWSLIDSYGHAVAGARITLDPAGPTAVSDSTGRFLLRDVPYGTYSLHFRRVGYRPDFVRFTLSSSARRLTSFFTPYRVFADPAVGTDSARRANMPGAYARASRRVGVTVLGEVLRAPRDSARRPAFDPLDPKVMRLFVNTERCGKPAYFVDGFLTIPARVAATGEVSLSSFANSADVDLIQVVASKAALDPRARDDAAILAALPANSCRPLVMIWTRFVKIID